MSAMKLGALGLLLAAVGVATSAVPAAAKSQKLTVTIEGVANGKAIPADYAFCVPAQQGHVTLGPNKSPKIGWTAGPPKTQSYAIIAVDTDAPSIATDVNKEDKTIPSKLKRAKFYHWVLVDIPASVTSLDTGADSDGVTAGGKPPGPAKVGMRGLNDYTDWFATDEKMKGNYGGYDGPCPPWNDTRRHHYRFTVYALDVPSLGLTGTFRAPDALKAMKRHALAKGQVTGVYALNPAVAAKIKP
ncbi:MAG: YbhB/YbcL family Raf kinase inhibitor-like protein [Stellaceae bacterium]